MDLTLICEMRIFIVRLAVFFILITERCHHAKGEGVCVAKRFFIRKAQGKSVQVQCFLRMKYDLDFCLRQNPVLVAPRGFL